jgi:hypothetical protein
MSGRAGGGAAKAQQVVGVEQGAGIKLIAQGITQHRFVVFLSLFGHWWHWHWFFDGLFFIRQRLHSAHGPRKQVFIRLCFALCRSCSRSLRGFLGVHIGDLFLDLFKVGQSIEFHTAMLPQSA